MTFKEYKEYLEKWDLMVPAIITLTLVAMIPTGCAVDYCRAKTTDGEKQPADQSQKTVSKGWKVVTVSSDEYKMLRSPEQRKKKITDQNAIIVSSAEYQKLMESRQK